MSIRTGEKLVFAEVGVEVVVTVGGDVTVTAVADSNMLMPGKRFRCPTTGTEVLVVKPGSARLECDGEAMELQEPKKTKAAD